MLTASPVSFHTLGLAPSIRAARFARMSSILSIPGQLQCSQWPRLIDISSRRPVGSLLWALPFGNGRRWLNGGGVSNIVFGGWQIGSIVTLQTGFPLTPLIGKDVANHREDAYQRRTLPASIRVSRLVNGRPSTGLTPAHAPLQRFTHLAMPAATQ